MTQTVAGLMLAAVAAFAQTASLSPLDCSISGTVTNAANGSPMARQTVSLALGGNGGGTNRTVVTDGLGRYKFLHLLPSDYVVSIKSGDVITAAQTVKVTEGHDVTGVDFAIQIAATISGTVMDREKRPILSPSVILLEPLYRNGKVVYATVASATGDLQGRYTLSRVAPGGTYLVVARLPLRVNPILSDEPEEVSQRLPSIMPSYAFNSPVPESSLKLTPGPGEKIESFDLQIERVPSYCIAGETLAEGKPAPLNFEIFETQGLLSGMTAGPGFFVLRNGGHARTGEDGKFRLCGLHPGGYRVLVSEGAGATPSLFVATTVEVIDRDVTKLRFNATPGMSLPGEVVADPAAPPPPTGELVRITISPASKGVGPAPLTASLPGRFVAENMRVDDYTIQASAPPGYYLKDVTYGGDSITNQTFQMGVSPAAVGVKLVLSRDGGMVSAKVTDSDGNAVSAAHVWFLPSKARTAAELETMLSSAQTDRAGLCSSAALAPGKYLVLATLENFQHTVADIDKLRGARLKGAEVELAPKASAQVALAPITIF